MPSPKTVEIIAALEKDWQDLVELLSMIPQTTSLADKMPLMIKLSNLTSRVSFTHFNIIVATDFLILGHEYKTESELTDLMAKKTWGKVSLTDNDSDIFRELSLFSNHADVIVKFKKMLRIIKILDRYAQYFNRVPDKDRFINTYFSDLSSLSLLDELAKEYSTRKGYQLRQQSIDPNDESIVYLCNAFKIRCARNEKPGAIQLHKIALYENTPFVDIVSVPPLLYLKINLFQLQEPKQYEDTINAVIKANPEHSAFDLLSTRDSSFCQTPLSNAIGLDNTNAALAFLNVITSSTMTFEEKTALINHCSRLNPEQKNSGFFDNTLDDKALYSATPLLLAIQRGNRKVVDLLCENPYLDPNLPDARGLTPLDWAFIMAEPEIISKLLTLGAKPEDASCFDEKTKTFIIDRFGPQNRQIYAHFWGDTDLFYTYRTLNPNVEKCHKVLENISEISFTKR